MVRDALEIIVGVINDDVFCPTVWLGFGGSPAEVLDDRSYSIAPFDACDGASYDWGAARRALFRRHSEGPCVQRAGRLNGLLKLLARISEIAMGIAREQLLESTFNPLLSAPRVKVCRRRDCAPRVMID
jgi:hypothetical protein